MADISLLEFGVYGFIAYSSLLMLIISVIKEVPNTKALSIARSIFLMPGIITAFMLAASSEQITMPTIITNSTIIAVNSSEHFTEYNTQEVFFNLADPVWQTVHVMIGLVLIFYIITQMLILLTRRD